MHHKARWPKTDANYHVEIQRKRPRMPVTETGVLNVKYKAQI